jgi:hypothetical protein
MTSKFINYENRGLTIDKIKVRCWEVGDDEEQIKTIF